MEQELKEQLEKIPPEERAAFWEARVRDEINTLLDIFIPEAITGNIGIKYDNPIRSIDPKTGEPDIDTEKASGVKIVIEFKFADMIHFSKEKPE
jgi:hypothetical protein